MLNHGKHSGTAFKSFSTSFQTEHVAVYWAGATAGTLAAQLIYPVMSKMVYRSQADRTKKSA